MKVSSLIPQKTNPFKDNSSLKKNTLSHNPFVSANGKTQNPFLSSDSENSNPLLPAQMKMNPLQRMGGLEEEEEMQMKKNPLQRSSLEEEELLQGKMNPAQKKNNQGTVQRQSNGGGSNLDGGVQQSMESTFNHDFSQVKVHPNSQNAVNAGALAYTQGTDIHFAPGQYQPGSQKGQELLGHELTHVVQQSQGRVNANSQVNGMPLNDSPSLEKEADDMGKKAVQAKMSSQTQLKKK